MQEAVSAGPLAGVVVVALEHAVAGPMATRQLADLGARVIKVERPDGGDFARSYDHAVGGKLSSTFVWSSRGKESVTLDLKTDAGREALERLLSRADVFVHNLGPGAIDRMGFAVESLRERFPRLVIATNSGYGETGSYAGRKAYDAIVQAESGLVSNTGNPEVMAKPGFSAADVAAGMYMCNAVLMGLYQRERTGKGTATEVAMLDAITDWIGSYIYYASHTGQNPERISLGHPSVVPYGCYRSADGVDIVIGVQNDREWARFTRTVLHREDLMTDERFATNLARSRHRDLADRVIAEALVALPHGEIATRLDEADIAYGKINTLLEAFDNPLFQERGRWMETSTSTGTIATFKPVIQERGKSYRPSGVPDLGEHTAKVLEELEYEPDEIERLTRNSRSQ